MFIWNFDDKRKTFMEILKKWFEFQLVIKKIIKTVESVSIFYYKIFHYWFFNFVIKKKKNKAKKTTTFETVWKCSFYELQPPSNSCGEI